MTATAGMPCRLQPTPLDNSQLPLTRSSAWCRAPARPRPPRRPPGWWAASEPPCCSQTRSGRTCHDRVSVSHSHQRDSICGASNMLLRERLHNSPCCSLTRSGGTRSREKASAGGLCSPACGGPVACTVRQPPSRLHGQRPENHARTGSARRATSTASSSSKELGIAGPAQLTRS